MTTEIYFDLSNLEEMLGGDKDAKLQMVKIFLQVVPENLAELNSGFQNNDLTKVWKIAHNLKSSIDIFCIRDLKSDIRRLESYSREEINLPEIPALVNIINTVMAKVIEQLKDYREELTNELHNS